jgi:hypothetical protein
MRKGYLVIELPNDVDDVDAEEIEGIFALVMRGVRRRVQRCMHRPMIEADIASSDRPEA